jgi:hypothetical protein
VKRKMFVSCSPRAKTTSNLSIARLACTSRFDSCDSRFHSCLLCDVKPRVLNLLGCTLCSDTRTLPYVSCVPHTSIQKRRNENEAQQGRCLPRWIANSILHNNASPRRQVQSLSRSALMENTALRSPRPTAGPASPDPRPAKTLPSARLAWPPSSALPSPVQ